MASSGKKIKLSLDGNKKQSDCFIHNDYYSDNQQYRTISEKALEKLKNARYEKVFLMYMFYCLISYSSSVSLYFYFPYDCEKKKESSIEVNIQISADFEL